MENIPFLLSPKDIYREFFQGKLGLNAVYGLFHREDFPRVIIGRKFFVTRPAFLDWWEDQTDQGIK